MIVRAAYTDRDYPICRRHYDMDTDLRGEPRVALGPVEDAREAGCAWCARQEERELAQCRVVERAPAPWGLYFVSGPVRWTGRAAVLVRGRSGGLTLRSYATEEQALADAETWGSRSEAEADLADLLADARAVRS